jgi:hypothetical protein
MNDGLRDKLVAQQERDRASEEQFWREMERMMETKLTPARRIAWGLSGLMGVFFVVLFSYVAWTAPSEFPLAGRLVFIAGSVFGAIWAGISGVILRRGTFHLKTDENMVNGVVWGFMVLMMTAFLLMAGNMENRTAGISLVLNGLVFIVLFGIPAIVNLRINRMEQGLREQMLRLQITLAEIAENQVTSNSSSSDSEQTDNQ